MKENEECDKPPEAGAGKCDHTDLKRPVSKKGTPEAASKDVTLRQEAES